MQSLIFKTSQNKQHETSLGHIGFIFVVMVQCTISEKAGHGTCRKKTIKKTRTNKCFAYHVHVHVQRSLERREIGIFQTERVVPF